ncbi:transposase [Dyadobacter sp. BHUBP1]|uniref:transposase n=1 Tax=Dyadobacter sp. BHUBP1 TaxID=3424178 RepID=UPI003D34ABBF
MKKKNCSETQIVAILKQYEGGREAMDVCREYGISKATLFNWRKKYSGMEAAQLKELKALQAAAARTKTVD